MWTISHVSQKTDDHSYDHNITFASLHGITMDLEETIHAVLELLHEKLLSSDDPKNIINDAKQRLMLVCMTYMSCENDALLSHLPPVSLNTDE